MSRPIPTSGRFFVAKDPETGRFFRRSESRPLVPHPLGATWFPIGSAEAAREEVPDDYKLVTIEWTSREPTLQELLERNDTEE